MCFSHISFSKTFLHKTWPKPIDEENGFEKVYILLLFIKRIPFISLNFFFSLIYFLYRFFLPYAQLKILCSLDENQNLKLKNEMEKHLTTDCSNMNFPTHLEFLNI